ncbi:MAG: helix-turn-helix transcriptional regulator, partial [Alphaproteobacteria bacterium]|nr:helix-turn-helix transcriptional regulator [Alphaproteobacteria bacterium]
GQEEKYTRLLDLIGHVYDAALDAELWPDVAARVAETFDSPSTSLLTQADPRCAPRWLSRTANFSEKLAQDYEHYYQTKDIWAQRAAQLEMGRVFESRDMVPDDDFLRSEYYQEWSRKVEAFYVVGSVFPVSGSEIGILGIHRAYNAGAYDTETKELVGRFLSHLQRALQVRRRLNFATLERQAALDGLERTGLATLVVGREGRIVYANGLAEALLSRGQGIRAVAGRLAVAGRSVSACLTSLIQAAADTAAGSAGGVGAALPIPREGRLPLTLLVAPLRPARKGFGAPLPAAIIFIRDPETPTPAMLAIQGLFGLTAAEAATAGRLADGCSIEEIAAAQHVSANTVRTHLKSVYAKTGTNRQVQLAALILRSVAALK